MRPQRRGRLGAASASARTINHAALTRAHAGARCDDRGGGSFRYSALGQGRSEFRGSDTRHHDTARDHLLSAGSFSRLDVRTRAACGGCRAQTPTAGGSNILEPADARGLGVARSLTLLLRPRARREAVAFVAAGCERWRRRSPPQQRSRTDQHSADHRCVRPRRDVLCFCCVGRLEAL